jgi:hypothetical protein
MSLRLDAAETATNVAVGLAVGWVILRAFGLGGGQALAAQGLFVAVAFARSFVVRRLFRWIGSKCGR